MSITVLLADDQAGAHGFSNDPRLGDGHRRARRGRGRIGGAGRGGSFPSGRRAHGHPDAEARRPRGVAPVGGTGLESPARGLIPTTFDLDDYVFEALRAGARGFLLKDSPPEELVRAVRVVATGEALLAPSITRRLIEEFARRPPDTRPVPPDLDSLTGTSSSLLRMMAKGLSNSEIATRLCVGDTTVKTHVGRVP